MTKAVRLSTITIAFKGTVSFLILNLVTPRKHTIIVLLSFTT